MSRRQKNIVDPLFQLFEHHLVTRSYDDAAKFTKEVAAEYLGYLDSTAAHVPFHVRNSVLSDLESEAHEMLVRKMYGCVQSADYLDFGVVVNLQEADQTPTLDFGTSTSPEAPTIKKG